MVTESVEFVLVRPPLQVENYVGYLQQAGLAELCLGKKEVELHWLAYLDAGATQHVLAEFRKLFVALMKLI